MENDNKPPFSDPFEAELEENEDDVDENVDVARDTLAVQQLLTHVPDVVIKCDHKKQVPYVEQFTAVCLFADISGFTSLCEKYSNLSDSENVTCGTDELSSTLNAYLGKIVEGILRNGGDVLKFAGDALFAMWKKEDRTSSITPLVNSATMCSLSIQEECDNFLTDVGVLLRVKTAVAVGVVYITYVGLEESKQFDMSGPVIDDANAAEKWAEPGSVVLSQLAWDNCEQGLFIHELIEDGHHYKVLGVKHQDVISPADVTNMSLFVASMSGMLTAHSVRMATPVIAKRALGPHLGDFFEKYFPYWKTPKIFRNTRKGRKEVISDKAKMSSGIAGLMNYDPDARLLMYSELSDQEVDDLRAYVPKPVLSKIDHHQDLEWLSEMRQVSVLFINMSLPDNVFESAQAIQKAYEVIYETIRWLKGNLNKVFSFDKGCTFVVIFGLPGDKHDDDPARAVIAGYRILEILHTILEITNESIGITTGRAFCGVVGHMDRHEYTVIGSKVNMAARLMMNYPSIVSCDEETYKAAICKLNKQDFDPLPSKPLKGIADPGIIREYTKEHDRVLDDDDEFDYPILGREKEQEFFRRILTDIKAEDSHLDSQGKCVLIVGEAGIGKTRMLEEFMDIAENEEFRMDFVEADMAHAQTPYYVVQNLITTLLQLESCSSISEREMKIQEYVKDEDLKEELCLLNDLLGTHIPGHSKLIHMDDDTVSEYQHLLLFEIVHQVVLKEPCIFAVENAHFIDWQSWNFLEDLVRDSHGVLVMTMKPLNQLTNLADSAKRLVAHDNTIKITLGGLSPNLMIDMACQFLDATCIPRDLEKIIREKSHGVASWCEQLVKDLLFSNYIKVVSDKEVVIQEDNELTMGQHVTNLHECIPAPVSRPFIPSLSPQGPSETCETEVKDYLSRARSALSRASFAEPSSNKPLLSFRRKSLNLVKTFTTFRRKSVSSVDCDNKEYKRQRKGSTISTKLFDDDDIEDEIFTGNDDQPSGLSNTANEMSADCRENATGILTPIPRYFMSPEYFIYAKPSAMVPDMHNMCIVTPGVDLSRIPVPESLREMVLARFDRMPPLEKVVLKCSSILGDCFPSELVTAIVPKSLACQVNIALYHLLRERFLECATLAHHHQIAHNHHGFIDTTHAHSQHHHHHHHHHVVSSVSDMVPCGCYVNEGVKVVNLTKFLTKNKLKKPCLYLKFSNNCVQETTYALWLKKQRESLHQRTAMHLESQAHKCQSCGGGAFLPVSIKQQQQQQEQENTGTRRTTMSSGRSSGHFSSDAQKRRSSRLIREKVQETGAFLSRVKERGTVDESIHEARTTSIGDDVMRLDVKLKAEHENTQRERRTKKRHLGGVGPVLISSSTIDDQEMATGDSGVHRDTAFINFLGGGTQQKSDENITLVTHEDDMVDFGDTAYSDLAGVDLAKCECAEVLASVFPQLVTHWRAAGNKLKTFRYLTESGAAALATYNNMQALSYLDQVQEMLREDGHNFVANKEERARVESLVGQAMLGMNRLDAALVHLHAALKEVGISQPTTAFEVSLRIYRELGQQRLRQIWPRLRQRNDYDACLLEQARCFFHISHVYHAEGMYKQSFMAALQELNTAERMGDNFHELLTAYTSVIECSELVSWGKHAVRFEAIAERYKQEARYLTPDDLITVCNFYAVSSTCRLGRGHVSWAADAGLKALTLANKLNDHMLKINGIPSLAQSLILMSKIDDCHDVLKELNYAAREKDDAHGRAIYYCNCFDLILETGHKLESMNECLQFTVKAALDPCLTWDFIVKYYLNASLALWYARCENWEEAENIFSTAKALQPATFEVIMAARAFVKIVEYKLLQLRNDHDNTILRFECQKILSDLSRCCKRFMVLKPRYYHMKAYYNLLCGKNIVAKSTLFKCVRLSTQMGTTLESEWAILSKHEWFDDKTKHAFTYTGHTKYPLPMIV